MKNNEIVLKVTGSSEDIEILRRDELSDSWLSSLTIKLGDDGNYRIKSSNHEYVVYKKSKKISETEEVIADDVNNPENTFSSRLIFGKYFASEANRW